MADRKVGNLFVGLGLSTEEFAKGIKEAEKGLKSFGRNIGKIGTEISKGLSIPAAGIVTGVALLTNQYDKALQQISRKTGKTGKDLKEFQGILTDTFAGGDDSISEVSTALSVLAQKTGLTGEPLKKLTETVLDLTDITGNDLNVVVDSSIGVFKKWQVAAQDQTTTLDFLFKISQQTGVGFDSLATSLNEFGTPLKALGFDLKNSALLLGNLGKSGLDAEKVINGMKLSIGKFVEAGLDPKQAFAQLVEQIKNADEASGNLLAKAATNNKVFLDFANAIRTGAFEVGNLASKLGNTDEAIATTGQKTEEIGQKISKVFNAITAPLAEAGNRIYQGFVPAIDAVIKVIQDLSKWVRENLSGFLDWTIIIASVVAVVGPAILSLKGLAFVLSGVLAGAWSLAVVGAKGLIIAVTALISPLGILTAAVAGGVYVWYTYRDAIYEVVNGFQTDLAKGIEVVASKVVYLKKLLTEVASGNISGAVSSASKQADTYLQDRLSLIANERFTPEIKKTTDAIAELKTGFEEATKSVVDIIKPTGDYGNLLGELTGEAEQQTKKIAELTQAWQEYKQKFTDDQAIKSVESGLESAIENVDQTSFDSLTNKLEQSFADANFNELKKQFGELGNDDELRQQAEAQAKEQVEAWGERMKAKQEQVYNEGVQFWRTTFENAITGVKFDLKDMLQQVAVGFAANLAQSIFGSLQGIKSPQDFGGAIFDSIFGDGKKLEGIGQTLGIDIGDFAKDALAEVGLDFGKDAGGALTGIAEKWGLTAGTAMGLGAVAYIYGSNAIKNGALDVIQGKGNSQSNFDTALNSNLITGWINPLLDAFGLGSAGSVLGLGKKNPETQARRDFGDAIKQMVKEVAGGTILMRDAFGAWKEWSGQFEIFGGDSKFNGGKGFEFLQSLSGAAQGAFGGVAAGLKEKLGLEDLDIGQAAAMLAENLGGSIDNLRQFVFALKLDFEDLKAIILQTAEDGTIKWSEYNAQIAGLAEAFKPGLEAVGDITGAVEELRASTGRGLNAVKGVKDIAQELIEAGVTQLDQVSAVLQAQGYSAEEANAIMQAFIQSGAETLQAIADGTNEFAGAIAGNIESLGFKYDEVSVSVQNLYKDIKSIDDIKFETKNLEIKVNVTGDEIPSQADAIANKLGGVYANIQMFAKGGVVNSPTLFKHSTGLGLMGEAGQEAILPLERIGGKLGVNATFGGGKASNTVNFNIDARGADNGVEERLYNVLSDMGEQIANLAVNQIADMMNRGQL